MGRQPKSKETARDPGNARNCPDSSPEVRLSRRQALALELLLAGKPAVVVAAEIGVNERTVRRWKEEPAFRAALATATKDAVRRAAEGLSTAAVQAVEVLALTQVPIQELMKGDGKTMPPTQSRVRAAEVVLRNLWAAQEHVGVADEVERIAEHLGITPGAGR